MPNDEQGEHAADDGQREREHDRQRSERLAERDDHHQVDRGDCDEHRESELHERFAHHLGHTRHLDLDAIGDVERGDLLVHRSDDGVRVAIGDRGRDGGELGPVARQHGNRRLGLLDVGDLLDEDRLAERRLELSVGDGVDRRDLAGVGLIHDVDVRAVDIDDGRLLLGNVATHGTRHHRRVEAVLGGGHLIHVHGDLRADLAHVAGDVLKTVDVRQGDDHLVCRLTDVVEVCAGDVDFDAVRSGSRHIDLGDRDARPRLPAAA